MYKDIQNAPADNAGAFLRSKGKKGQNSLNIIPFVLMGGWHVQG